MRKLLSILLLLFSIAVQAQDTARIFIQRIPKTGILLDKGWKFQAGDHPELATLEFDDSHWQPIDPTKDIRMLPQLWKTYIGWFRLHILVDSAIAKENIGFLISQTGASEIYLNGQLIRTFGIISTDPKHVQAATPVNGSFIPFPVSKPGCRCWRCALQYRKEFRTPISVGI